jgi:hypothetical protein
VIPGSKFEETGICPAKYNLLLAVPFLRSLICLFFYADRCRLCFLGHGWQTRTEDDVLRVGGSVGLVYSIDGPNDSQLGE